jgi:class 3 adenylate cyclase
MEWPGQADRPEAAFRDNAINAKNLPNLTAEDLKDMGIGIVGHRRELLDAITLLRTDGSAKASPAEPPSTLSKPAQDTAERRQVTVMFSDLVAALSARMDPEDLREVISAYQKCVAETVQRFGGFVAKYMGDGVRGRCPALMRDPRQENGNGLIHTSRGRIIHRHGNAAISDWRWLPMSYCYWYLVIIRVRAPSTSRAWRRVPRAEEREEDVGCLLRLRHQRRCRNVVCGG